VFTILAAVRWTALLAALAGLAMIPRALRDRVPAAVEFTYVRHAPEVSPALGWSAVTVVGLNPFRWDHKATSPRYDRAAPAGPGDPGLPGPPPEIRPGWRLTGILWGTPPVAVFEGVEGHAGPGIFAAGDTASGVTVTVIWPDSVLLRQGDRAWTYALGPRRPEGVSP
jgi:hypothetical protein